MNFYIREWDDGSATLMTDQGNYLFTFRTLNEARLVCNEWYRSNDIDETLGDERIINDCVGC